MMSHELNERLTRTGHGTAAGTLMRLYWQPAALAEELAGERPVKAVRLLGQDLVLFRDRAGGYGLLDRDCAHRGADLAFGRIEDGGLRCAFHGWLFDANGRCLETPAEPEGSTLCHHVRQKSYPVVERSGIVFAYLGDGAPPAFPDFDCFVAPATHVFAFKGLLECNWLQALEVGIDPAHASYLHRFFEDESPDQNYGRQFRGNSANSDMPMTKLLRDHTRPSIEVERTRYGMRLFALRRIDDATMHVRVTNLAFPNAFAIPLSAEISITQWHVPIDDFSCYWYAIFTSFTGPVDAQEMREQRLQLYTLPDYRPRLNKGNNYGFDAAEQQTRTYTGMGDDINVHDQWAVESQGAIHNRTREHLGQTDKGIALYRRILLEAIEQAGKGEPPPMVLSPAQAAAMRGPASIDCIGPAAGWEAHWQEIDARHRRLASWRAEL
jgi:phthalate 4,5-dioxygenase oxygenase subunit